MKYAFWISLLASCLFSWAQDTWPHQGKYGADTRHLLIKNYLNVDLHIGVLSGGDSPLKQDDFLLKARMDTVYEAPNVWPAARIWGRIDKNATGPFSLAEFTLGKQDYYDVSLVDGYNLPVVIALVPGTYTRTQPNDAYQCGSGGCVADLLSTCPAELVKKDSAGKASACLSACTRFNTDAYCCRGAYGTPQTCKPDAWPVDYSRIFKDACPSAYSYAYDDATSTFICPADAKTGAGPDYSIAFGAAPAAGNGGRTLSPRLGGLSGNIYVTVTPEGRLRCERTPSEAAGHARLAVYDPSGRMLAETEVTGAAGELNLPGPVAAAFIVTVKSRAGAWIGLLEAGHWIGGW